MRERALFVVLVVVIGFSVGCATRIDKKGFSMALGNSTSTEDGAAGGSMSDGFVSVVGDAVKAAVTAASMLPGVSAPPPSEITVVVEDDRDKEE